MTKITGQQLKKQLIDTQLKEMNLVNKIEKKFDLIITEYIKYIPSEYRHYLEGQSIYNLDTQRKLDVIIQTEDNYIKATGDQQDLFNDENE